MNPTLRRALTATAVATTALTLAALPALASGDPIFAADTQMKNSATIGGAGSTFAAPLQNAAQPVYTARNSKATITGYQAVGSGAGIKDISTKVPGVNWGGSDVPMMASDLATNHVSAPLSDFLQVPIGLGGEAISYNLKTVSSKIHLKLTAAVIANIYLGKIKTWNNAAIKALNKTVKLPSNRIVVVARADKSGTTFIYTDFLHTAAPSVWKTAPSKNVLTLPSGGLAGNGNSGVASDVANVPNSIGYLEYSYVLLNPKLQHGIAAIQNRSGKYLVPSIAGIKAGAAVKPNVSATSFSIVYLPGATSYPIIGYTWAIVWKAQKNDNEGTLLVKYLDWLSHSGTSKSIGGQVIAGQQGYVPLPTNIQQLARNTLLQVRGTHHQVLLTNHA
jgi:phosphate transport system substrate-binding protein